jgi:hypothetical protein
MTGRTYWWPHGVPPTSVTMPSYDRCHNLHRQCWASFYRMLSSTAEDAPCEFPAAKLWVHFPSALAAEAFGGKEFPYQFLAAFGFKDTTIARLRKGDASTSDVSGAVLLRNNIHLVVTEAGKTAERLAALKASPKTAWTESRWGRPCEPILRLKLKGSRTLHLLMTGARRRGKIECAVRRLG